MNSSNCNNKYLLDDIEGVRNLNTVDYTTLDITNYFFYMVILLVFGSILVISFGFCEYSGDIEPRKILILNLLFFTFGIIGLTMNFIMYYTHLSYIESKDDQESL